MKRSPALLLQVVVVLFGLGALAFMLWEPHLEGRNAHATTFEIYFKDPFLACAYVGSTPFFVALYRAFRPFGHFRQSGAFSQGSVDDLRVIRRCALALIGFVTAGLGFIILSGDNEDRPAGVFMSLLVILPSSVIALTAGRSARKLQNALSGSGVGRG